MISLFAHICAHVHTQGVAIGLNCGEKNEGKTFIKNKKSPHKEFSSFAALKTWKSDKFFPIITADKKRRERRERSLQEKEEPKS